MSPRRYVTRDDQRERRPIHAVWELTLACDLACKHCGSRAGARRKNELGTEECIEVVRGLARLGTRHITLIGGEAYLRKDWCEIIRAIRAEDIDCTLQTGGLNLTPERLDRAIEAGLLGVGVSIDGLEELHDHLRGVRGSFEAAFSVLSHARERKISATANTQLGAAVIPELEQIAERLIAAGVEHWQIQLTVAMGRAADHPELLLQPHRLLEVMPLLARLHKTCAARGLLIQPGNNIGYFGPYESLWRSGTGDDVYWQGCAAGSTTIGIEADGTIKGCPSLPTNGYTGGNVRNLDVETIWRSAPDLEVNRDRGASDLWGFCGSCYYADVCKAGCTWTSHSLLGRPGNNPYCHHRVLELERRGLRERIVRVEAPPGDSFDHGRFELVLESLDGRERERPATTAAQGSSEPLVQLRRRRRQNTERRLELCRGCNRHLFAGTAICPHCGGDVHALGREYSKLLSRARRARSKLESLMSGLVEL